MSPLPARSLSGADRVLAWEAGVATGEAVGTASSPPLQAAPAATRTATPAARKILDHLCRSISALIHLRRSLTVPPLSPDLQSSAQALQEAAYGAPHFLPCVSNVSYHWQSPASLALRSSGHGARAGLRWQGRGRADHLLAGRLHLTCARGARFFRQRGQSACHTCLLPDARCRGCLSQLAGAVPRGGRWHRQRHSILRCWQRYHWPWRWHRRRRWRWLLPLPGSASWRWR